MLTSLAALIVLASPAAPAPAATEPAQRLKDARKLVEDLKYEQALKLVTVTLDQAKDMDRDTLVGLYELSAIASAAVDKGSKAKVAFQYLLTLEPDYELSKNLPPRTRTPFFEAKTWLSGTKPVGATVEADADEVQVKALKISVTSNDLVPARTVRVALVTPGGESTKQLPVQAAPLTVDVGARFARYTVEVLGDKGVLFVVSGDAAPVKMDAPPVVTEAPPVGVTALGPSGGRGWMRPTGITLGAAGVAALIGGGVLGFLSTSARNTIANAEKNSAGVVVGITEREAQALDAQARTFALVANVLFVAGGVLAATGVGLFIFGGESADAPAVTLQLSPLGGFAQVRF